VTGTTVTVLPPATGAWREGDPVGDRLFLDIGAVYDRVSDVTLSGWKRDQGLALRGWIGL